LDLDVSFYLIAAPAVLFAGISKGGFGGGAAFAGSTLLALALEPVQAAAMMLPLLMVMDLAAVLSYWGKWSPEHGRRSILGGLPGIAAGAVLFAVVSADVVRLLIGAVALGFVAYRIALSRGVLVLPTREVAPVEGYFWGAMTGFTSFVSHAGGPPAAVYLLSLRPSKTEYQANTVLIVTAVNVFKFVPYAFLGMFTAQTAIANLALAPFAVIGAWLGVKAHHMVPERAFFLLTYVLLVVTGAKLIWDGLTG